MISKNINNHVSYQKYCLKTIYFQLSRIKVNLDILIPKRFPVLKRFFENLPCGFQDPAQNPSFLYQGSRSLCQCSKKIKEYEAKNRFEIGLAYVIQMRPNKKSARGQYTIQSRPSVKQN